jgi:hypothetical protein
MDRYEESERVYSKTPTEVVKAKRRMRLSTGADDDDCFGLELRPAGEGS